MDRNGRDLFIFLITTLQGHVSGLYYMPKVLIEHDTLMTRKEVDSAFAQLLKRNMAYYDDTNELVLVMKMFRHQGKNHNMDEAAQKQLLTFKHSPLASILVDEYGHIEKIAEVVDTVKASCMDNVGTVSGQCPNTVGTTGSKSKSNSLSDSLTDRKELKTKDKEDHSIDSTLRGRRFSDNPQHLIDLWNEKAPEGHNQVHTVSEGFKALIRKAYKGLQA
jgi:hypothetical protein